MLTRSQLHRTSNITYISRVSEVGKNDRLTKLQQNIIHARLERLYLKDLHRGNQQHHYDKLKKFENFKRKMDSQDKNSFHNFCSNIQEPAT